MNREASWYVIEQYFTKVDLKARAKAKAKAALKRRRRILILLLALAAILAAAVQLEHMRKAKGLTYYDKVQMQRLVDSIN